MNKTNNTSVVRINNNLQEYRKSLSKKCKKSLVEVDEKILKTVKSLEEKL